MFYGVFAKSDLKVEPEDTDDFYALEEELKMHFVKVRGQLYSFYKLKDVDPHGFALVIEPKVEGTPFIAHWYNGGAGVHEVVEDMIEAHLVKEQIG